MHHGTFMTFMFESTFDHKFNVSDIDNSVDVDAFVCVYDHDYQ